MKTKIRSLLASLLLASAVLMAGPALANDCTTGNDNFATGALLYGDMTPDTKHSINCLMPQQDGPLLILMLGADSPVKVEARINGRTVASNVRNGEPFTRELNVQGKAGQRIDVRVEPLGKVQTSGTYRLLVSSDGAQDPDLFAISRIMDLDKAAMLYTSPEALQQPLTLGKQKMANFYFPGVMDAPYLRFSPTGISPDQLVVGTIDLATGQTRLVDYREGFFRIPMTKGEGFILTLGSKAMQPITFNLNIRAAP